MKYRIAGIDVHKRMLAVVIADVSVEGEYQFERRKVGTSPSELCRLAEWFVAEQVEEVVMESTAQYWRPVWATLEQVWRPKRVQVIMRGVDIRSVQGLLGHRNIKTTERYVKFVPGHASQRVIEAQRLGDQEVANSNRRHKRVEIDVLVTC